MRNRRLILLLVLILPACALLPGQSSPQTMERDALAIMRATNRNLAIHGNTVGFRTPFGERLRDGRASRQRNGNARSTLVR